MQERLSFPARPGLGGRTGLRSIGDFWRVTPLARKEPSKRGLLLPVITSRSRVSRVEMLIRRCRSFNSMHASLERQSKEAHPSWLPARPVCRAASPHTRPGIRNPPHGGTIHSGSGLRAVCANTGRCHSSWIIDGCRAAGGNRSAFPGACDETNVRYVPLIGHSGKPSRGREATRQARD